MIKAVCFDIGGVLISKVRSHILKEIAQKYGLVYNEVQQKSKEPHDLLDNGLISEKEYWGRVVENLGVPEAPEYLAECSHKQIYVIPGISQIVKQLKTREVLLVLVSNVWKEVLDYIFQQFEFLRLFDLKIFSHEVGVAKPNQRFFEIILEKCGISTEECFFIDDHDYNVRAAQESGMDGIVFQSADQLRKELMKRHLL